MNYSKKFLSLLILLITSFLFILLLLFFPKMSFFLFPNISGWDMLNIYFILIPIVLVILVIITFGLFIREKFFIKKKPPTPPSTEIQSA